MGRRTELTKGQIANLRANQARRLSMILTRVAKFANGELLDKNGEKVSLTMAELKAAQLIRDVILPTMQSTEITESPDNAMTKAEHEKQYADALNALKASLKPEDIKHTLAAMDKETRQALIDSLEATSQ